MRVQNDLDETKIILVSQLRGREEEELRLWMVAHKVA